MLLIYLFNGNNAKLLPVVENVTSNNILLTTVLRVYGEESFETIFLLETMPPCCFPAKKLTEYLPIPLILTTINASEGKLMVRFDSKILAIVC